MEEFNTQWTRDELKAYILLFCSKADFEESTAETKYINEKFKTLNIEGIRAEFERDNDYQSIQKIKATIDRLQIKEEGVALLEEEIKELFLVDGELDTLEKNLFIGLKHILEGQ